MEILPALSVLPPGLLVLNSQTLRGRQNKDVFVLVPRTCDYTEKGMKVANQLTLIQGDYSGVLGPMLSQVSLTEEEGGLEV